MRAADFFRYFFQLCLVGFREGGGNWAVRLEDRIDETGSLRARIT